MSPESCSSVVCLAVVIIMVFGNAFFTDGEFTQSLVGWWINVPRENGIAIALADKFWSLVNIIFLLLVSLLYSLFLRAQADDD